MSKEATLTLPWPPTVNTYYRSLLIGKRCQVLKSKAGRVYERDVLAAVLEQGCPRFHEDRIELAIRAHPPDRRARDLDNIIKSLQDSLAQAGVYANDAQIDSLLIVRGAVKSPEGLLHVTIRSVETAGLFPQSE